MKSIRLAIAAAVLLFVGQAQAASYEYRLFSLGIRPTAVSQHSTTYATLNSADMGSSTTLSNGNLTDVSSLGSGVRGTIGKSSGKWYFEMTVDSTANGYAPCVGIVSTATPLSNGTWVSGPGEFSYYGMWGGQLIYGNGIRAAYGGNFGVGDVIGVAVDLDNRQITYYKNGVSLGVAYTSAVLTAGTYYPFVSDADYSTYSSEETFNFGETAFKYAVPTGYNPGWYQ